MQWVVPALQSKVSVETLHLGQQISCHWHCMFDAKHIEMKCSGWCQLCCGRHCSCWTSPVRRYLQIMLSDQRKLPDLSELKVTNHMNREAIQQVRPFLLCRSNMLMPCLVLVALPWLPCPALPTDLACLPCSAPALMPLHRQQNYLLLTEKLVDNLYWFVYASLWWCTSFWWNILQCSGVGSCLHIH